MMDIDRLDVVIVNVLKVNALVFSTRAFYFYKTHVVIYGKGGNPNSIRNSLCF
jgi:hypothetical protein